MLFFRQKIWNRSKKMLTLLVYFPFFAGTNKYRKPPTNYLNTKIKHAY
jgi:hypothetical protein